MTKNFPKPDVGKRIAIFLDGTWNKISDNTNVWRLKSLCSDVSGDRCRQVLYYDRGPNGFLGGTFGKGLIRNVIEAYEWLVGNFDEGDEIFIFGFSRGAFTARSLAGFVAKYGLLRAGEPLGVGQLYDRYRRAEDRTIRKLLEIKDAAALSGLNIEEKWMLGYSMPVNIKMVGVWDTVGSHGIPMFNIPGVSRSSFTFLHTGLRIPIENGFHALAIDEHRSVFPPTLWTVKASTLAPPRSLEAVQQRWFVGTHGNVGGGYHSNVLALRPLQWIAEQAERLGLAFRERVRTDDEMYGVVIPDSRKDFMGGCYGVVSGPVYREIGRAGQLVDGVASSIVNETIDFTVFERWRRDKNYRPQNLQKWLTAKGVSAEQISATVRADDPSIITAN